MFLPYSITFANRSKKNYDVTEAVACRGEANGATAPSIQAGWHPKSEIARIEMLCN